jgi:hypothetical protein
MLITAACMIGATISSNALAASASGYPQRPVRLILGTGAGATVGPRLAMSERKQL